MEQLVRETSVVAWRRASSCHESACVEVAHVHDSVLVRDSKAPDRGWLTYSQAEWRTFVAAVKAGEFDVPTGG